MVSTSATLKNWVYSANEIASESMNPILAANRLGA